ncbi:MAG: CBS domain-containing protein [Bacilli bacterium]|nr:CBS domain-containing protein [Bacilli bacterium]
MENIISYNLITNKNTDKIFEVANNMLKNNIGFIPIEKDKKIIGVITDRDIAIRIVANKIDLNQKIEDYITKNIVCINKNNSIEEVKKIMIQNKIKRLLVEDNNKIIGVISLSDIILKLNDLECSNLIKTIFENQNKLKIINSHINDFDL